ncbi:MAG: major capsid protein [Ignavibacteriaceae bacterium]
MSTLSKKRVVDPVLSKLARGYHNAQMIATHLFPIVTTSKEGGKIPEFTKESFKIYKTERAIRAKSNRINPEDRTEIDYVLTEHDLEYPLDYREIEEDMLPAKINATKIVTDGISLRLEKLAADLAQDLTTYPTGHKVTLGAGDKFDNITSDPFATINAAKEQIRSAIAVRPNTCILGASAYASLKEHPAVMERIKYSQKGIITPELLKALFDFDNLVIGDSVYASDDDTFNDVWSDNVIVAYVPPRLSDIQRSFYEPSFAYTLRKKNNPIVDSYDESGKVLIIRNTDIFEPKVVGSAAGYLINDVNA